MTESASLNAMGGEILVVDDDVEGLQLLVNLLSGSGYRIRAVGDPELALTSALASPPELVLLDIRMPGMDGFEVCRRLKGDPRTADLPILFVSASNELDDQVRGFREGGVDYITKPIRRDEVLARIRTHLELHRIKRNLEAEVRQRTEALRESEAMFRGVFENAGVGVLYLDAAKRIIMANEFFLRLAGKEQTDLRGCSLLELLSEPDRPIAHARFDDIVSGDSDSVQLEARFPMGASRKFWGNVVVGALRDINQRIIGFPVIVEDITLRKEAQAERDATARSILESRERLRELSSHLQNVREEEKANIAREIHDELGGTLTAIKLDTVWLRKKLERDRPELCAKLDDMVDQLNGVIDSTRRIVTELRPTLLDDLGLWAAIEWQVEEFGKRTGMECFLSFSPEDLPDHSVGQPKLNKQLSITVYRLVQEALTNILRHAEADEVRISCVLDDTLLTLSVQDNGKGVTKERLNQSTSHGIRGMYERTGALGGQLRIDSGNEGGTTVSVKIPINGEADHE